MKEKAIKCNICDYSCTEKRNWNPGPSKGLKIQGCQYYLVGVICPPLVEIGLTGPSDNRPGTNT
jgi:hypothetical protein